MQLVIIAGGFGKRLRPLTVIRPNALIPLVDWPLVLHILVSLPPSCDEVIIAVNYLFKQVRDFFREHESRIAVRVVDEPTPLGTGGALKNVERYLRGPFAVYNGDIVDTIDFDALVKTHRKAGGIGTIAVGLADDPSDFGSVEIVKGRIARFVEKPARGETASHLVNAGRYVFEPGVFDFIERGRPVSMEREVFPRLIEQGLTPYRFEGWWSDAGTLANYLNAQHLLLAAGRGKIAPDADVTARSLRALVYVGAGSFEGGPVGLARDPRLSGPMLVRAAASGLMSAGCDVIDLGMVPTPCAQYFVAKSGHLKGAIVVTASHNPREFNGLKAIDARGMEMRREDEESIEAIFFEDRFHAAAWSDVGSSRADDTAIPRYMEAIEAKVDAEGIRKRNPMVVVDPGNGAGCVVTPYLLRSLGCRVLTLNAQPDGAFPGQLPEPTSDHLGDLMRVVSEVHADLGIAHDGDADRATFVDDKGAFVVGDKALALLARAAVKGRGGTVVTPVSTSSVVEEVVRASGGKVMRTRVGSPIVARAMFESGAVFGGEANGGVIFPDHQFCRDGAMSAAKMLELLAHEGKSLSALVAELPQYHIKKANVEVPVERREAVLAAIVELAKGRKVDSTDGVKILETDGAVLVRPSGTEPIFRVYAEAKTPDRADALAEEGVSWIKKALGHR